jgi:predicted nucleic acid-binding protein
MSFGWLRRAPLDRNGLGFDIATTQSEVQKIQSLFPLLDDMPGIYQNWQHLVALHQAKGKPAHDARLVAAMSVHGVGEFLTFNKPDFIRYTAITVRSPAEVLGVTT